MAKEFTFLGEIRRGWSRYWRLSWWWKAPTLGLVGFILLSIAAAAIAGPEENTSPYPPGSLTIVEPANGAVVTTKEVTIKGTAPSDAEVRRDVNFGRDKRIKADANGEWEHEVSLDEGENSFQFFLQEAKSVQVKLVVQYAPPTVTGPTTTVTPEPTENPSTESATPSPKPSATVASTPTLFPGVVDVTKLFGRSAEEIALILGQPEEFRLVPSDSGDGKIEVRAGRLDAQEGFYRSRQIDIIFINGGARHIIVQYPEGTGVDDALTLVGLPDAEPNTRAPSRVSWNNVGGFYSASVMINIPNGQAVQIYLITEDQYAFP